MKKESKTVETWMPFLIDKYLGDTTDLNTEQHGAYVLLLLSAWKKGGVLPNDDKRLAAITKLTPERWQEHKSILLEFFKVGPEGLTQKRLSEELDRAKANVEQRSAAGKASAAAKAAAKAGNGNSTVVGTDVSTGVATDVGTSDATGLLTGGSTGTEREPQRNSIPIPIPSSLRSEEEKPPRKRAASPPIERPEDVDPQTWADWQQLRKAKNAPITATVLNGARTEAAKAGMPLCEFFKVWCRRGSQGLEADWLKPHERGTSSASTNKHGPAARAVFGTNKNQDYVDV